MNPAEIAHLFKLVREAAVLVLNTQAIGHAPANVKSDKAWSTYSKAQGRYARRHRAWRAAIEDNKA